MIIPDIQRSVFFNGQSLEAEDLTALEVANRELRWLHNSTLHNWGIAAGFEVQGQVGDTVVTVQPGYGLDIPGREVILTSAIEKPIPAVPGAFGGGPAIYYITASYLDDSQQSVEQRRDGVCLPGGTVRLSEQPSIDWRTASQLRDGIDLILGQASIQNCQLFAAVSAAPRRYARACRAPYLRAGSTLRLPPIWTAWRPDGHSVAGFTTAIDTSGASFQSVPRYSVGIIGPRATTWSGASVLVLDFASIAEPTAVSFTLQVALPSAGSANPAAVTDPVSGPRILNQLGWTIVWTGVEG
jgi:hypothetical protein